jgi:hypothetical protein
VLLAKPAAAPSSMKTTLKPSTNKTLGTTTWDVARLPSASSARLRPVMKDR